MQRVKSSHLLNVTSMLNKLDINYCLLWETAIFAWGISNNGHLQNIDVLVSDSFAEKYLIQKDGIHYMKDNEFKEVRFWTPSKLKLNREIAVTECVDYACYALAPELQLQKMQYFPEKNQYYEDIAKLAASVYANELTRTDYEHYTKYVRN